MAKIHNKQENKDTDPEQNTTEGPDQGQTNQDGKEEAIDGLQELLGFGSYKPTALQAKLCYADIHQNPEGLSPTRLLTKLGYCRNNWYVWQGRDPAFIEWFDSVVHSALPSDALRNVHRAMYSEALKGTAQDRKLFLQRFDKGYKPKSSSDSTHTFKGFIPPDDVGVARSKERQKRFLAGSDRPGVVVPDDAVGGGSVNEG